MHKHVVILVLVILSFAAANGQQVDVVKNYNYKVIERRIYPDTTILGVKYYDKLSNEIADYDPINEKVILRIFKNKNITHEVELFRDDTLAVKKYRYSRQKRLEECHRRYEGDSYTELIDTVSSGKSTSKLTWYEILKSDTIKIATWIVEHDSFGRISKRFIDIDSGKKYSSFSYKNVNENSKASTRNDYENDSIVYVTITTEDKVSKLTINSDLRTRAKTKVIEYFDKTGFIYRKEIYGTIFYTCVVNDPRRYGQDKTIKKEPDEVYTYEKFYYR